MRVLPILFLLFGASSADAATIVVNSHIDFSDSSDGLCTLREAITAANSNLASGPGNGECLAGDLLGMDQIAFAIPGAGPHTITVIDELPHITSSLSIDGYTQPGALENNLDLMVGFDAILMIRLTGGQTAVSRPGLRVAGPVSNVQIRGLEIFGFTSNGCCADNGIVLSSAHNVQIGGNVIHDNKSRGLFINAPPGGGFVENVVIGGSEARDRNLVYAHTNSDGINLSKCVNCRVENNWIGVSWVNEAPVVAPSSHYGITLSLVESALIRNNWIWGSRYSGIMMSSYTHLSEVRGNVIGGSSAEGYGVVINHNPNIEPQWSARDNLIIENTIVLNGRIGVWIISPHEGSDMAGNVLRGNRIYGNGLTPIDLGLEASVLIDGPNPNDAGDADAGPNGRQNYPVLAPPEISGQAMEIGYTIDSNSTTYTVEFAFSSSCQGSGFGPGGLLLLDPVVLDGMPSSGTVTFSLADLPEAGWISALATGDDGTSEYGHCQLFGNVDPVYANGFEHGFE